MHREPTERAPEPANRNGRDVFPVYVSLAGNVEINRKPGGAAIPAFERLRPEPTSGQGVGKPSESGASLGSADAAERTAVTSSSRSYGFEITATCGPSPASPALFAHARSVVTTTDVRSARRAIVERSSGLRSGRHESVQESVTMMAPGLSSSAASIAARLAQAVTTMFSAPKRSIKIFASSGSCSH